MTCRESLEWLYGLQVHGIKLGLENTARLCAALDIDPASGAERRFIHVAGTNGKGSVCAMLAAVCVAAGKRTGLYTSPHLVSFRERIRLGNNLIPEEHVAEGLTRIRELTTEWPHLPTFFEVTTALALSWFQTQRAEWIILETGLGGRLDATNIVTPVVSVITPVGMDHTQHLGGSLVEIAREKAGIIKRGVPLISAPQTTEVAEVLTTTAASLGSPVKFISNPIGENWRLALPGGHQRMNAAVAFAALVTAGLRPEPRVIAQALGDVEWPGRFQVVNDGRLILDGAHNPEAARVLAETWGGEFPGEKATILLGIMADKDIRAVCRPLLDFAARIICVPIRNPRALPAAGLAEILRGLTAVPCSVADDIPSAIAEAERRPERALVAGSLFLVGEALAHLGLIEGAHEVSAQ